MDPIRDELSTAARAARLATVGLAVQGAIAFVALGVALASGSFAVLGASAHLGAGALAWAAGLFLATRRSRLASEEALETRLALAAESEGRKALFSRGAAASGPTEARLAGALALVLALVEAGLAVALVIHGRGRPDGQPVRLLAAGATLTGSAFVLILLAKFSLALTQGKDAGAGSPLSLTTAGARRAASGAIAALAVGVLCAVENLAPTLGLDGAGYVLAGIEGVVALELVLGLVLELYRPRKKGDVPRPAYESRLLGLLAEPSGVARSLARAVDYQFGFQLSETWVYGLVERGIAPLLIFVGATFWLLSCVVVVPQGDRAILEHLGAPRLPPLEPGFHLKLPWPIEAVEPVAQERLRSVVLGDDDDEDEKSNAKRRHRAIVWTKAHAKDEYLILVARPASGAGDGRAAVDVLAASVEVQFVVSDPMQFSRGAVAPEALVKAFGERELARLGCSKSLFALLGPERAQAAAELQRAIQASADDHHLGVRIVDVGLEDLHPPVEVASAFHAETGALEEKEARRLQGLEYAATLKPRAESEARSIRDRARAEAAEKAVLAEADASQFGAAFALDRAAPHVFRSLRLLRAIDEALVATGRKIVVPHGTFPGAVEIDLGDKVNFNELPLEDAKTKEKR
jgi:membrane protease subunit HflK